NVGRTQGGEVLAQRNVLDAFYDNDREALRELGDEALGPRPTAALHEIQGHAAVDLHAIDHVAVRDPVAQVRLGDVVEHDGTAKPSHRGDAAPEPSRVAETLFGELDPESRGYVRQQAFEHPVRDRAHELTRGEVDGDLCCLVPGENRRDSFDAETREHVLTVVSEPVR